METILCKFVTSIILSIIHVLLRKWLCFLYDIYISNSFNKINVKYEILKSIDIRHK